MARIHIHRVEAFSVSRRLASKFTLQLLREIELKAKERAARGDYATGRLATSIHIEGPHVTPERVTGRVGSSLPYAASAEHGAKRHRILPIPPRTTLKFYWRKVGRIVYMDRVSHPGMRGKRYLLRSAQEVAAKHGLLLSELPLA